MPPKVLIVEDEADFRDGLVELLKLECFDANGVGSIKEYGNGSSRINMIF